MNWINVNVNDIRVMSVLDSLHAVSYTHLDAARCVTTRTDLYSTFHVTRLYCLKFNLIDLGSTPTFAY